MDTISDSRNTLGAFVAFFLLLSKESGYIPYILDIKGGWLYNNFVLDKREKGMDVTNFFIINFFLLSISLALILLVIRDKAKGVKMWYIPMLSCGFAVLLAISSFFEDYLKNYPNLIVLVCFLGWLGYSLRPAILLLFLRQSTSDKRLFWISAGLVILNALIYSTVFFIGTEFGKAAFYYLIDDEGILYWNRGPLGYSGHVISFLILGFLLVINIFQLRGQRRFDAVALLVCSVMIITATMFETFEIGSNLLNTSIAVSTLFFYLHVHSQANKKDALTGLFERKSYYEDLKRMEHSIRAVIQIDMNSLKELNDNEGHAAGDEALITIAKILDRCLSKNMYLYRMGGDEFLAFSMNSSEEDIVSLDKKIEEEMAKTRYSVAIGYSVRQDTSKSFDQLAKEAEVMMYQKKSEYYESSGKDRRVR